MTPMQQSHVEETQFSPFQLDEGTFSPLQMSSNPPMYLAQSTNMAVSQRSDRTQAFDDEPGSPRRDHPLLAQAAPFVLVVFHGLHNVFEKELKDAQPGPVRRHR